MPRFAFPLVLFSFLLVASSGHAAKVRVWHHHSPADFEKARLQHTVISNEGALRLARQLKPLATLDATHIWDVAEDRQGNLLVATGNEGTIYKLATDGKISALFKSDDSQVLCLALSKDGTLYAGTGPGGLILKLTPDGQGKVLCKTGESYVWSLALDPGSGTLYAGTGPKGRIYAITPSANCQVFYQTKQEHVLSLALGRERLLYAGTDKDGLVYRIDEAGKAFVVCSVPQAEVRGLLVTVDGVYAGTSSPVRRKSNNGTGSSTSSGGLGLQAASRSKSLSANLQESSDSGPESDTHEPLSSPNDFASHGPSTKGTSAAPALPPGRGENSLYFIGNDGAVRELFREKAMLLSLLRQNGRILVGTGMEGQLFEVDESTKERSEVARLDHGQIHCLCRRRDGSIVLGTGDPGRLYVLQDRYATSGTVTSDVLDAKLISKWGALRWSADVPADTRVTVAARSGNTPEPSETWSDWSTENTDGARAVISCPAARFLQYRVTLATEDPKVSPSLHGLALRYVTTNQAPEVTSLQVPDLDGSNLDKPKKLHFKWTATDPNEDDLTYSLSVRKEGWKSWVQLEDRLDATEFDWDTTTTPSGIYQLKVVASDRKDNPPEEALTGARTSRPFVVAHVPPTVNVKTAGMEGHRALIEAVATDPLVRLTAASYSVNGKTWVNVFPTDGIFDSKEESFKFRTDSLKPGTYVIVLRVQDAAGNVGSGDVVFTVKSNDAGQ
jgi:hypothetical protein